MDRRRRKYLNEYSAGFLKDGRTQREAFEEAAQTIGRTPGACSFRWNNKLKKNLQMEEKKENNSVPPADRQPTLKDCIDFLQKFDCEEEHLKENKTLKNSILSF